MSNQLTKLPDLTLIQDTATGRRSETVQLWYVGREGVGESSWWVATRDLRDLREGAEARVSVRVPEILVGDAQTVYDEVARAVARHAREHLGEA